MGAFYDEEANPFQKYKNTLVPNGGAYFSCSTTGHSEMNVYRLKETRLLMRTRRAHQGSCFDRWVK